TTPRQFGARQEAPGSQEDDLGARPVGRLRQMSDGVGVRREEPVAADEVREPRTLHHGAYVAIDVHEEQVSAIVPKVLRQLPQLVVGGGVEVVYAAGVEHDGPESGALGF